jgi:hypothetical protein
MERKRNVLLPPPPPPPPEVGSPSNNNTRASRPSSKPRVSVRSKKSQKRREDNWDDDSLHALSGYAALSRDEITGAEVDWQHLTQGNDRGIEEKPDDSESEAASDEYTSVSSRDTKMSPGRRMHAYIVNTRPKYCASSLTNASSLLKVALLAETE